MFYEIESADARNLVKTGQPLVHHHHQRQETTAEGTPDAEQQQSIFSLDRVQYQFPGSVGCLQVSHNILHASLATLNHSSGLLLLKIDLGQPDAISGNL